MLDQEIEQLYERYGPMVVRRCRHILKDEEQAAEVAQDVFVELLRRKGKLDLQSPAAYLHCAATRLCLNRIRSRKRHPEDANMDLLARIAQAPEDESRTLARSLLDRLFQQEQPSTRTIAVLHLLDGMTLEEVAAEVGLSVSGVRKRLRTLQAHIHELEVA